MAQPHEILGVAADASPEAIKRAFFRLAKLCHPDAGGSKERFVLLQSAYESMMESAQHRQQEVETNAYRRTEEESYKSTDAERKSTEEDNAFYEDLVQSIWEEAERYKSLAPSQANHSNRDSWVAILATLICPSAIATSWSFDGQIFNPALWTFVFSIALIALVWLGGTATMIGTSLVDRNPLQFYAKFVLLICVICVAPIIFRPSPKPASSHTASNRGLVPEWWPVTSNRIHVGLPRGHR